VEAILPEQLLPHRAKAAEHENVLKLHNNYRCLGEAYNALATWHYRGKALQKNDSFSLKIKAKQLNQLDGLPCLSQGRDSQETSPEFDCECVVD